MANRGQTEICNGKAYQIFTRDDKKLLYIRNICVLRNPISTIMSMNYYYKVNVHVTFSNTVTILYTFHWRHKTRDVNKYMDGLIVYQKDKMCN